MKRLFASLALVLSGSLAIGQIVDPVQWKFTGKLLSETEAEITASATIEDKWHVYALKVSADPNASGPIPTSLRLDASARYTPVGKVTEGKYITHHDPNFDMDLNYFEQSATFKQKIKFNGPLPLEVKGVLEYMACDDSKCIFPAPMPFTVVLQPLSEADKGNEKATEAAVEAPTEAEDAPVEGIKKPVRWQASIEGKGNNGYVLSMTAIMEAGWHIYAQVLPRNDGPVATSFSFDSIPGLAFSGKVKEGKPKKEYDPNYMMDLFYFEGEATFVQEVTFSGTPSVINGAVKFMACNAEGCLPPKTVRFVFDPAGLTASVVTGEQTQAQAVTSDTSGHKFQYFKPGIDKDNPFVADCSISLSAQEKGGTLWEIFILGFIGGLLALLTPCVFPMVPLTVTFFTKGSNNRKRGVRNAVIFGIFVLLIYLLFSLPFHLIESIHENIFNEISTNVSLNIFFFVTFVVFAISFFGYFEITLPSSIANRADKQSNTGGIIGAFFMALTLAIVSFSCTGPILGSLLASSLSTDGGAMQLSAGMAGFGLALGIPFAIFAMFPSWMQALPKSGGWLNSVKVVLAFLEVAAALKFFSNADLVTRWGLLKYEVFMGLWILVSAGIVLYLLGFIRFPHDSKLKKRSVPRMAFAVLFTVVTVYLCSGFRYNENTGTYHSLPLLSGLAPPVGYSWIYPKECPHNLNCEHDYEKALARARAENKPLFIDFTGYACVNCRKVEEHIWIDPAVLSILDEEVIVVSLHVDDRVALPDSLKETVTSARRQGTRDIVTWGDRWSVFQIETFVSNSQPYYCLVTPDETLLTRPIGYSPDLTAEKYEQWLRCGLDGFRQYSEK